MLSYDESQAAHDESQAGADAQPGRSLALDVGDRRVGVALSDELGWFARPLTTFMRHSQRVDCERVGHLVQEQQARRVIVGYPLNTDGSAGAQAQRVARYAAGLRGHLTAQGVLVVLWDERYSTEMAQERLIAAGRSAAYRRSHIDEAAAALILQDYLDTKRRNQTATEAQLDTEQALEAVCDEP